MPSLSGIDAAYPDYAEFFGTDGAYSTYGLAVAGQYKTAIQQLDAIRTVSRIVNGNTGKVVHEINSTGAMYYGDNSQPGDINETTQFRDRGRPGLAWSAIARPSRTTTASIKDGEHYLASLDPSPSDLWPAGDGIQEDTSLGQQVLDVASEHPGARDTARHGRRDA